MFSAMWWKHNPRSIITARISQGVMWEAKVNVIKKCSHCTGRKDVQTTLVLEFLYMEKTRFPVRFENDLPVTDAECKPTCPLSPALRSVLPTKYPCYDAHFHILYH